MKENQLENEFRNFLLSRGYPKPSLLTQMAIKSGTSTLRPDLVIVDLDNAQYVALVEFKRSKDYFKNKQLVAKQFDAYSSALGSGSIPTYIVFPVGENDFEICVLTKEYTLDSISKDDFPSLEALSIKQTIDFKLYEQELDHLLAAERLARTKKNETRSYLMVGSVVLGIVMSIISTYLVPRLSSSSTKTMTVAKLDSLFRDYEKSSSLEKTQTSPGAKKIDTVYASSKVYEIERRLRVFEDAISNNPDKLMPMLQMKQEIQQMVITEALTKELMQEKFNSLNSRLDLQNGWLLGIMIAIFGVVLSTPLSNIISKLQVKSGTDNSSRI
jgi:hypothetical protein